MTTDVKVRDRLQGESREPPPIPAVFPRQRSANRQVGRDVRPLRTRPSQSHPAGTPPPRCRSTAPACCTGANVAPPREATGRARRAEEGNTPSPHEPAQPPPKTSPPHRPGRAHRRRRAWPACPARMVRHYESLGLISGVARTDSGYRQYTEADVHALHFIRHPAATGFSMKKSPPCWPNGTTAACASSQVKRIAKAASTTQANASPRCRPYAAQPANAGVLLPGHDRPDCPILDDLGWGRPLGAWSACPQARLAEQIAIK